MTQKAVCVTIFYGISDLGVINSPGAGMGYSSCLQRMDTLIISHTRVADCNLLSNSNKARRSCSAQRPW